MQYHVLRVCTDGRLWSQKLSTWRNINSQLVATIIILLKISISSTCFGRYFRPSSGTLGCVYSLWYKAPMMLPAGDQEAVPPHPGHQQAASSVLYTTSCKHSLVFLRMGESIARNMLSWLKLLLLHLVGCLYYYISDARSHKHQISTWHLVWSLWWRLWFF